MTAREENQQSRRHDAALPQREIHGPRVRVSVRGIREKVQPEDPGKVQEGHAREPGQSRPVPQLLQVVRGDVEGELQTLQQAQARVGADNAQMLHAGRPAQADIADGREGERAVQDVPQEPGQDHELVGRAERRGAREGERDQNLDTFVNSLGHWQTELLSQKHFINEHLASSFHYQKHEMLSLEELCIAKLKNEEVLYKKFQSLTQKK